MTKPFTPRFSLRATAILCAIFFLLGVAHGGMMGFYAGMGYVIDVVFIVGN